MTPQSQVFLTTYLQQQKYGEARSIHPSNQPSNQSHSLALPTRVKDPHSSRLGPNLTQTMDMLKIQDKSQSLKSDSRLSGKTSKEWYTNETLPHFSFSATPYQPCAIFDLSNTLHFTLLAPASSARVDPACR